MATLVGVHVDRCMGAILYPPKHEPQVKALAAVYCKRVQVRIYLAHSLTQDPNTRQYLAKGKQR